MTLRVSNIRMPVEEPEDSLRTRLARRLGIPVTDLVRWRILRKSLDARSRHDLKFVYSAAVELTNEQAQFKKLKEQHEIDLYIPRQFNNPAPGDEPMQERPVIVGSGPAGLLAAYYLAQMGYRPLIIERGEPVKARVPAIRRFDRGGSFEHENNYLFGEGGAGTFSDGKLTCRLSGPDVDWVLDRIVECGGKPSIRYEHRPHLGSNRLPLIVRNFRRTIEANGGEYNFACRLEDLVIEEGRVRGVATSSGFIKTSHVILAIGHSARDTYRMLYNLRVPIESKPFQLGLRIEQPQEQVNQHLYGRNEYFKFLGAADYTLVARGQKNLYTFCMCAGGYVIPSISEPGLFCTNGMSNSRNDSGFANSGLVVTLDPREFGSDHPLAGVELQRRYESIAFQLGGADYKCPIQPASAFLSSRAPHPETNFPCSYQPGTVPTDLSEVIPDSVVRSIRSGLPIMDKQWRGHFLRDAMLVGPEIRGSSPVRIVRNRQSREVPGFNGLYPVGEGAGYAGGIVSAAVDGLRSAKKIVDRFAPLERVN